jgi:hypothetical protein
MCIPCLLSGLILDLVLTLSGSWGLAVAVQRVDTRVVVFWSMPEIVLRGANAMIFSETVQECIEAG